MKTKFALCLLGVFCLFDAAMSQGKQTTLCVLGDIMMEKKDFPDIESLAQGSYQMTVEFTLPGEKQTDYYVEYFDTINRLGRVDAHQEGDTLTYIYNVPTWEAWNIKSSDRKCQLNNATDTPDMFRDYQTNWRYEPPDAPQNRTMGPSAMFKQAREIWMTENTPEFTNDPKKIRTMGYLGEMPHTHIRGENAQIWRWCKDFNTSVDFFFSTADVDDAYNIKVVPLRVTFNGNWEGEEAKLSQQSYDIISFQPYTTPGINFYELPIGLGCTRADDLEDKDDYPKLPNFENNMFFYAEVIYRKVDMKTDDDQGSYYSNLMIALDRPLGIMAYFYTPWNTTRTKDKSGKEKKDTFIDPPEYVVYDLNYRYFYKINYNNDTCEVDRTPSFTPSYRLPEDGGYLDLNNPYVLFPNDEFDYLGTSKDRGVEIDVYEAVIDNYLMNSETLATKVIATHSYVKGDQKTDNIVSVKHTPIQIQLRLFRDPKVLEILTFNIFGFSTKIGNQRRIFDLRRCYKNDDDYSWVNIGFATASGSASSIAGIDSVDLEYGLTTWLDTELDIRPIRVPTMLVDIKDELYVTMLVLQKPTLQLDFTEKEDFRRIEEVEGKGLMTFDSCATDCLENENDKCWGFALCGGICYIGDTSHQKTIKDTECTLYKRFTNETYMKSKERLVAAISEQLEDKEASKTISVTVNNKEVKLKAVSILVTNPSEGDPNFEKMGNKYSERMRNYKVGKKLKNGKVLGKLGFEECQRLCLDYQDCESLSFCMMDSRCSISTKYAEELQDSEIESDPFCQIATRRYADNFEVNPGFFLKVDGEKTIENVTDAESCARSCLKEGSFRCLSFDLCGGGDGLSCRLHSTHFLKTETRKEDLKVKATCRHYTRKYSVEFKKSIETKVKSETFKPLTNLNVEECAKTCMDYGQGACYAFDFCQGKTGGQSSCTIIDSDPSRIGTVHSSACTHYRRTEQEYAPRPYTNSYASGIGFLCFLIGGLVGAAVVFVIAYIRVNRQ